MTETHAKCTDDEGNGHARPAAQSDSNGPYFGMIPRWVAPLDLTGADHRVLLVMACHADKVTRIVRWRSIEMIVDETDLDRRTVQRSIRRLEGEGVLRELRGGGRGRSSEYQIIFETPDNAANSGRDTAVSEIDDAENSGNDAALLEETAASSSLNSGVHAAPTEEEQKERTPPSGERAREGEGFSNDRVEKKQGVLLMPMKGGREQQLAALRAYTPSDELVDWAAKEFGIDALADNILGKFKAHHCASRKPPPADREAAYRKWIYNEPNFAGGHNARGLAGRPRRPSMLESTLDRLRGYNG